MKRTNRTRLSRRITLLILGLALVATGCSGSQTVAVVDGETITLDDVPAVTDAAAIDAGNFRIALTTLIRVKVLSRAAEQQFGVVVDDQAVAGEVERLIQQPEQLRANGFPPEYINERFLELFVQAPPTGMLVAAVTDAVAPDFAVNEWIADQLAAADIEVNPRFGVWLNEPSLGQVYETSR